MIIICGSGRSGTSAVARLVHESGISVGNDLIEPDEHNAEGYFEERLVVMMNDALLNDVGLHKWFSVASRAEKIAAVEHGCTDREVPTVRANGLVVHLQVKPQRHRPLDG